MQTWNKIFNNINVKNDLKNIYEFIETQEKKYEPLKVFK